MSRGESGDPTAESVLYALLDSTGVVQSAWMPGDIEYQ